MSTVTASGRAAASASSTAAAAAWIGAPRVSERDVVLAEQRQRLLPHVR